LDGVTEQTTDTSHIYKRAGSYIEYGNDIQPDLSNSAILKYHDPPTLEETDEEDNVYPLSIKYDKKKARKIAIYRYIFLFTLLIIMIPTDLYTNNAARSFEYRTGFWANRIFEETIQMSGVTEFSINPKNCIIYILENTKSSSEIELYVSADRNADVSTPKVGTVQYINFKAANSAVQCYAEIKIPGGVTITKLSLTLNGDSISDLVIRDFKDDSTWKTPMTITTLEMTISDSYPNVLFHHAHVVTTLTVSGTYCA
jgi:hypothetical protein